MIFFIYIWTELIYFYASLSKNMEYHIIRRIQIRVAHTCLSNLIPRENFPSRIIIYKSRIIDLDNLCAFSIKLLEPSHCILYPVIYFLNVWLQFSNISISLNQLWPSYDSLFAFGINPQIKYKHHSYSLSICLWITKSLLQFYFPKN